MAAAYEAKSVHIEYRHTTGRWTWRLVDFFGCEISRKAGFKTKALARTDAVRAKADYLTAGVRHRESPIPS